MTIEPPPAAILNAARVIAMLTPSVQHARSCQIFAIPDVDCYCTCVVLEGATRRARAGLRAALPHIEAAVRADERQRMGVILQEFASSTHRRVGLHFCACGWEGDHWPVHLTDMWHLAGFASDGGEG